MLGPRLLKDRQHFPHNNMVMAGRLAAGILWLGWNGFNGGDPYYAGADMAAAVVNTNLATAVGVVTWMAMDAWLSKSRRPTFLGMVNGMICGLVAITPCAGWVNGWGALAVGVIATGSVWFAWNFLSKVRPFTRWTTRSASCTPTGSPACSADSWSASSPDPNMLEYGCSGANYTASSATCTPFSVGGLVYTGSFHQLWEQGRAAVFVIFWSAIVTFILMKVIGRVLRGLRYSDGVLESGDFFIHDEVAFPDEPADAYNPQLDYDNHATPQPEEVPPGAAPLDEPLPVGAG